MNADYHDILAALVAQRARWRALAEFGALALRDLVKNKLASGRDKDRVDVKGLEGKS